MVCPILYRRIKEFRQFSYQYCLSDWKDGGEEKQMKMRLKACRVQAGMLIKEVAQAIGVSEMTVINWEKGISSPEVDLGLKLSLLYKIPLEYMDFTKDGNKDRRKKA